MLFVPIGFVGVTHYTNHPVPQPMILLDSSQQYNTNNTETVAMQSMQQQYCRSHSHPAPSNSETQEGIYNPSFQRPYSFTDGQVSGLTDMHGENKRRYENMISTWKYI